MLAILDGVLMSSKFLRMSFHSMQYVVESTEGCKARLACHSVSEG